MAEETKAMDDLNNANLSPGNGPTTIPLLQDADRHFRKAAAITAKAPTLYGVGINPFDYAGRTDDALTDEETNSFQILWNYGNMTPGDQDRLMSAYRQIQADDQRLQAIQSELRRRGY